jgi:hypothetical protein
MRSKRFEVGLNAGTASRVAPSDCQSCSHTLRSDPHDGSTDAE